MIHVLLVEDNPADVLLTQIAARESVPKVTLHHVGTAADALAFLRQEKTFKASVRPDFILLDLGLPKVDGRVLFGELRADPVLKDIPVVVLTASPADSDVILAFGLHADGFLRKPVSAEDIAGVVKKLKLRVGAES